MTNALPGGSPACLSHGGCCLRCSLLSRSLRLQLGPKTVGDLHADRLSYSWAEFCRSLLPFGKPSTQPLSRSSKCWHFEGFSKSLGPPSPPPEPPGIWTPSRPNFATSRPRLGLSALPQALHRTGGPGKRRLASGRKKAWRCFWSSSKKYDLPKWKWWYVEDVFVSPVCFWLAKGKQQRSLWGCGRLP